MPSTPTKRGPTLRRDGIHRLTVRVDHHLTGADIAEMLCRHRASGFGVTYEPGNRLTKVALDKFVRAALAAYGDEAWAAMDDQWADDCDDYAEAHRVAHWAEISVGMAYPDLKDAALDAWFREYIARVS